MTPPAAVVEKMAEALIKSCYPDRPQWSGLDSSARPQLWTEMATACVAAADEAGWVLVSRDDVEGAADSFNAIARRARNKIVAAQYSQRAARLRSASDTRIVLGAMWNWYDSMTNMQKAESIIESLRARGRLVAHPTKPPSASHEASVMQSGSHDAPAPAAAPAIAHVGGTYERILRRAAARLLWHLCPINTPVSFHEDWRKLHSVVGGDSIIAEMNTDRPEDEAAASPAEAGGAALGTGHWWCPECKEEIDGSRVTYHEYHDTCGTRAVWKEPAPAQAGEGAL